MKIKLLTHACLFLLFLAFISSCKKEAVKPTQEETESNVVSTPKDISIEYVIYASSGNFTLKYTAPDANGEKLIEYNLTLNKMMHNVVFDWKSGNRFKLSASNVNPSTKEVTVEIYINGILYSSALANSPNGVAAAEAMVY